VLVRWEREILFGPQVAVDRPDELESGCQVQPALTVEEEVLGPLRRSGGWGWEGRAPQRGDLRGALQRVLHSDADIPLRGCGRPRALLGGCRLLAGRSILPARHLRNASEVGVLLGRQGVARTTAVSWRLVDHASVSSCDRRVRLLPALERSR